MCVVIVILCYDHFQRQATHRLRGTVRGAVVVGTLSHCAGAMGGKSLQDLFGDGGDAGRERPACMKSRSCGVSQNRTSKPVVAMVVEACNSKKDTLGATSADERGRCVGSMVVRRHATASGLSVMSS